MSVNTKNNDKLYKSSFPLFYNETPKHKKAEVYTSALVL